MTFLIALALALGTTTLTVPGRTSSNVSMAADGRSVAVVWSASAEGGSTDIYSAFSRDGGATFSSPTRVNSTPGAPRVGGEQPPQVALVSRPGAVPAIVVVWTEKGTSGTTLMTAQSVDGGRTFGRSVPVPGSEAAGNRGWEAIAADRRGRVHAIWLDHRELAQPASGAATTHPAEHVMPAPAAGGAAAATDGVARAQRSKLYFATLGERTPAKAITGGVCYCCKTTLAAGAEGSLYAAWRHVYPGNLRDIAFTVSRDGGRTFASNVRVNEVPGTAGLFGATVAMDRQHRAHVAWFDNRDGDYDIYVAREATRGEGFSAAVRVNDDKDHPEEADAAGDEEPAGSAGPAFQTLPSLAIDQDGIIYTAWQDYRRNQADIYFSKSTDGGRTFSRNLRVNDDLGRAGQLYPSLAVDARGALYLAWHDFRRGNQDVYFSRSTDGGRTFSPNIRVNDDPGTDGQFNPSLAVDADGTLYLVWHDLRAGQADIYVATSADGNIVLVNAQTERLFGYRRDELVGVPIERRMVLDRTGDVIAQARCPQTATSWNRLFEMLAGAFGPERYHLGRDLRHAVRGLGRRKAFAFTAVLSLALGIGANTAIFSMFNRLLLKPLPVTAPEQLVNFGAPGPKSGSTSCNSAGSCEEIFSYPMFRDLEAQQTTFTGIAAHRLFSANVGYGGETRSGDGLLVSGSYFPVLGIQPALGRLLGPSDDQGGGGARVVVLSYGAWQNRFAGDSTVIGRALSVNGETHTIVGVATKGFHGHIAAFDCEVWVPLALSVAAGQRSMLEDPRANWLEVIGVLGERVAGSGQSAGGQMVALRG